MNTHKFHILLFITFSFVLGVYSQDDCIVDSGIELIPGPTPDPNFTGFSTYPPETTVQMCYAVEEYNTPGTQNWMHGIVPLFGPGWDLSTLQPVGQPETQMASGEWIWVGNVVAGQTGELISPAGWWFDANSGGGSLNGDPADNWGDGNNGPWEFCWEISTQSCPPAFNEANLIVEILNFADSETGSWENQAQLEQCIDDPSYYIQALQLNCPTCDESDITIITPTCENIDQTGGVVVLTPQGVGPWNYIWFNLETGDVIEENNNVSLPVTVSGLETGEYLIQVEDLGFPGGCSAPVYFEILPPEEILVEFDIDDANCFNLNDGSILITSIMNSNCIDSNLIAEDSNLDGNIDNDDFSCPSTASEVCGCDNITYFNSCQAENWYGITNYEVGPCDLFPNYTIIPSSSNPFQSPDWDGEIINLLPGDYTFSIFSPDNTSPVFGCVFDTTITINSPDELLYNYTVTDVDCFFDANNDGMNDLSNGLISIELTGGTADYTIILYDDFANELLNTPLSSSPIIIDNLPAGDYWFAALDSFGCSLEEQEVFFTISEPSPIELESLIQSSYNGYGISCADACDGYIDIDIKGGIGFEIEPEPDDDCVSYQWTADLDGNGIDDYTSINANLSNLCPGTYVLTATDCNGCEFEVAALLLAPEAITIDEFIDPVLCNGASEGKITIDVLNGVGFYSFSWQGDNFSASTQDIDNVPAGDYTVSIIDSNNCEYEETFTIPTENPILISNVVSDYNGYGVSCNGESDGFIDITVTGGQGPYVYQWDGDNAFFETTEDISNLSPGFYSLNLFDVNMCQEVLDIDITEPEPLVAGTDEIIHVLCTGDNSGSIISFISGGVPPYNESLSDGSDLENLSEGTYTVNIIDDNNCEFNITDIYIGQPDAVLDLVSSDIQPVSCAGYSDASIAIEMSGGTEPYFFSWEGVDGFNASSQDLFNIVAGDYTVLVIDANGCDYQETFNIDSPSSILISENVNTISCFNENDGEIDLTVTGGVLPYTYEWSNDLDIEDINNLSPGVYSITVTDGVGCSETETYQIAEPPLLTASIQTVDVDCFGDDTGYIISSINGGTPPYNEDVNGGADTDNLSSGTYTLTITDDNNCQYIINNININQPLLELQLDANTTNVSPCNGDQTGSIIPNASGGTPPYSYSTNIGVNLNSLNAGTYTVFVEDANGCQTDNQFTVDEPDVLSVNLNVTDASCFGVDDGVVTASPSGGELPYSLIWTDLTTGFSVNNNNLTEGNYQVSLIDGLGCVYIETFTISEPPSSEMDIVFTTNDFICLNPFDVSVVSPTGTSGFWSINGPGNGSFSNEFDNQTTVTVSEYGVYDIMFTNDCGEVIMSSIQMFPVSPVLIVDPNIIYCLNDIPYLQATSQSTEGVWALLSSPDNTTVTFVDGVNAFNTELAITNSSGNGEYGYGEYLFSFTSCGVEEYVSLIIEKTAPEFGLSTYEECSFNAAIVMYNPEEYDGEWIVVGANSTNLTFNSPTINVDQVSFSVTEQGFYEINYVTCNGDEIYQHFVGFSCPLEIPNAFTPNGDSNNDLFLGTGLISGVHAQINFTVFNRSGQIVHAQSNFNLDGVLWDGTTNAFDNKKLNDGVYYYTLDLFNRASQKKEFYTGYIHLFGGVN